MLLLAFEGAWGFFLGGLLWLKLHLGICNVRWKGFDLLLEVRLKL